MVQASDSNPFEGQERVGDFFSPFFTVRFMTVESQQGTEVDGETGAESTVEVQESGSVVVSEGGSQITFSEDQRTKNFRNFVTKLTVTVPALGVAMLELVMEPPFEEAIQIVDNKLMQWNSLVVVEFGWSGSGRQNTIISDKHFFVISQPKLEMKGTDITITVTGVDPYSYSSQKRETRTVFRRTEASPDGTTYSTDLMILETIARKNKMRLNTSLAPEGAPIRQQKPIDENDAKAIEQNEKDYLFFRRICDMNRCDYFVVGDTIFIVDHNIARVQKAAFRFVFWNAPRDANDVPMLSFSTQALPSLFCPAESKEVVCKSADEDKQSVATTRNNPSEMSDNEAMGERGAGGTAEADGKTFQISSDTALIPNPRFAENETGRMMSCPSGQPNRDEYAKRVVRDANSLANRNAEATVPGCPRLVPSMIVRVDGVGRVFSGAYLVLKVVHTLTTDGFESVVTLICEASTGDDVAGRGQRPITGGNNPEQAPGGDRVEPTDADEAA